MTHFRIQGITCMDCAEKFRRKVADLPGVRSASLNTLRGTISVEGGVSLDRLRELGRAERYTISPLEDEPRARIARDPFPLGAAIRAACAAGAFGLALLLSSTGSSGAARIAFAGAMALGGVDVFRKGLAGLARFHFNESVLMTVAVVGALAIGEWSEAAAVSVLFSISDLLETWSAERTRRSVRGLMDAAPEEARVLRDAVESVVPAAEVRLGDTVLLRPGERVPVDGIILSGASAFVEASITGESVPAAKGEGEAVFAGTLNAWGAVSVEATSVASETTLAKIVRLVEEAQANRSPVQTMIERFAAWYTPAVMVAATLVAVVPPLVFGRPWDPWIYRALSLLVLSCPCALVISTPAAVVSAISTAARSGVLIKGGRALEAMGRIRAIAFDKTGTLTEGRLSVADVAGVTADRRDVLAVAGALEARSAHPIAAAVTAAANAEIATPPAAEDVRETPGCGISGLLDGSVVRAGNLSWLEAEGVDTAEAQPLSEALERQGRTVVAVARDLDVLGLIGLSDALRTRTRNVLESLRREGIERTVLLTGDNERTARTIAEAAGADEYRARLLPADKLAAVRSLVAEHGRVAMVGDGVNDAPAMAAATVGIAMGGAGSDTALEAADIALMGDDLSRLPFTIRLSRRTLGVIRQNVIASLGLKLLALAAIVPGWLTLWLAIMADMGATILVTLNSLRLLRDRDGRM
jgi:Cd2+/Zn2+-exporting ATPase